MEMVSYFEIEEIFLKVYRNDHFFADYSFAMDHRPTVWWQSSLVTEALERIIPSARGEGETCRDLLPLRPTTREALQVWTIALTFHSAPRQLAAFYQLPVMTTREPLTVSFLHWLVATGQAGLARALIATYGLNAAAIEALPGPSLLLMTLHLYLHPTDVLTWNQQHQDLLTAEGGINDWEALTLLGELLYLGVRSYMPQTLLASLALQAAYRSYESLVAAYARRKAKPDATLLLLLESKLIAVCQLLYARHRDHLGVSHPMNLLRNVPVVAIALFPHVYQYLACQSGALTIQRAWRRYRQKPYTMKTKMRESTNFSITCSSEEEHMTDQDPLRAKGADEHACPMLYLWS